MDRSDVAIVVAGDAERALVGETQAILGQLGVSSAVIPASASVAGEVTSLRTRLAIVAGPDPGLPLRLAAALPVIALPTSADALHGVCRFPRDPAAGSESGAAAGGGASAADLPVVSLVMGSKSDLPIMEPAARRLQAAGLRVEVRIISAHRTPTVAFDYATTAEGRGVGAIIAGAGGAAHLPGVIAGLTPLPVLGVPIGTKALGGLDSLYSIAQMPPGVPVGTLRIDDAIGGAALVLALLRGPEYLPAVTSVAINGARNAGLLAVQLLSLVRPELRAAMANYKKELGAGVLADDAALAERYPVR